MCKFLSAIVKRDGEVLYRPETDSHENLVDYFGLSDSGVDNFVRVEFTSDTPDKPDTYKLRVDETKTPAWFEEYREKSISYLRDKIKSIIVTGERKILMGGCWILSEAKVGRLLATRVIWMKNSQVNEMRENSRVNVMRENSQVNVMWENSWVNVMRGNSQVNVMWENSWVNVMLENSKSPNPPKQDFREKASQ